MNAQQMQHINDLADKFSASIDGGYADPGSSEDYREASPYYAFIFTPENLIMPIGDKSEYSEGSFSFTFRVSNFDSEVETIEFSAYYEPVENEAWESDLNSLQFNQTYNVEKDILDLDLELIEELYQKFMVNLNKMRKALDI